MTNQEMKDFFNAHPEVEYVEVQGEGCHCALLLVSQVFSGKSKLERQKWVYRLLKERFIEGQLHALNMQTITPEEWRALRG